MINSPAAYLTAALTAAVLLISGVAMASQDDIVADFTAEPVSTTVRAAPSTTIIDTTLPPVPVVVPVLGGMNPTDARAQLRDAGLVVTTSEIDAVVDYAIDVVVASEPAEGTSLLPGDTINIVVGRRPSATFVERAVPLPWATIDWVDTVDETIGRCSNGREGDGGLTLDLADCAEPHDFQFFATIELTEAFSTREEAGVALRAGCDASFESFVGAPIAGSDLVIRLIVGWDSGVPGASGSCLLGPMSPGLQLVGDAAGSLW